MTKAQPIKEAIRITNLWRKYGPETDKIDIGMVVSEIIRPTLEDETLSLKYTQFDTFDGVTYSDDGKHWVALVNENIRSPGRRNFTAAHELFHFIGHRHIARKFECGAEDLLEFDRTGMEREANDFALQLLLPPDRIRERLQEAFNYETVKALADSLGASVAATAYRWVNLAKKQKIAFIQSRDEFMDKGRASIPAFEAGFYIKNGKEIPPLSMTTEIHQGKTPTVWSRNFHPGCWHPKMGGTEHVHQTSHGDYTYTFLEFDN